MRSRLLLASVLLVMGVVLSACGSSGDKIGSTVKGTRLAILVDNKTLKPDPDSSSTKPALPSTINNADWPQVGYDTAHVLPNARISDHLQKLWTESIGEGSSSDFRLLVRPVVGSGVVVAMDSEGLVTAFDSQTGERKWRVDTTPQDRDEKAIAGGLAISEATVYVTTGFGEVLALNEADGAVKWRRFLPNPLRAAPTIAGRRVYVVSIDNELTALDTKTGDVLWHHNGIAESATLMGASSPAVVGDEIIVAYSSGEIFNLRAENGRASWNYALTTPTQVGGLPAIADIRGLPVVDRGRVFAISHSGRMAAIEQRTGDRAWETDVGGVNTPLVAGDAVFLLSNDNQLVALLRETGRILWVQQLQQRSDPDDHDSEPVYWTGPILAGSHLWLTNSLGQLVSFSPEDGKALQVFDLDAPSYIAPITADGIFYIVTDDGELTALR